MADDRVEVWEATHLDQHGNEHKTTLVKCGCCDRLTDPHRGWDSIYGCCNACAICASLEHFPCCHGDCDAS